MSLETREAVAAGGLPLVFPPHLTENFEKADRQLRETYGVSPGVEGLLRLWVACGTSSQIRREFERAVLDIKRRGIDPNGEGQDDDDLL